MKRYVMIQSKRLLRYLPGALAVMAVLVFGLLAAFSAMTDMTQNSENQKKVGIAVVGAGDDPLVELAMSAMTALDSSQYTLDVSLMSVEEAQAALRDRTISAYVEAPEDFVQTAMNGRITTLRFVTRAGATGLITVFRDEVTTMISDMVLASQKGVYGFNHALVDVGGYSSSEREEHMNAMNMKLIGCILTRDGVVALSELGIGDGLRMEDYLLCGLLVLLMMLSTLPFAPLHVRSDHSLSRMLAAKGHSAVWQTCCDLACWFVWLSAILLVLLTAALTVVRWLYGETVLPLSMTDMGGLLPVLALTASMSFMLYAATSDLVSGVLLQFFVTAAMCFVSGCMYPVFFFPETIQRITAFLPTGAMRTLLAGCTSNTLDTAALLTVLAYTVIFAVVGVLLRVRHVKWGRV